jgi:hypothetical protein
LDCPHCGADCAQITPRGGSDQDLGRAFAESARSLEQDISDALGGAARQAEAQSRQRRALAKVLAAGVERYGWDRVAEFIREGGLASKLSSQHSPLAADIDRIVRGENSPSRAAFRVFAFLGDPRYRGVSLHPDGLAALARAAIAVDSPLPTLLVEILEANLLSEVEPCRPVAVRWREACLAYERLCAAAWIAGGGSPSRESRSLVVGWLFGLAVDGDRFAAELARLEVPEHVELSWWSKGLQLFRGGLRGELRYQISDSDREAVERLAWIAFAVTQDLLSLESLCLAE